jgi:hypothetical protein
MADGGKSPKQLIKGYFRNWPIEHRIYEENASSGPIRCYLAYANVDTKMS